MLVLLLFGMSATLVELLLLAHAEDATQLIPVALAAGGIVVAVWNLLRVSGTSVRTLQLLMVLYIAAGIAGAYYHFQANVEFQLEIEPSLAGSELLWKVLQAKAPPALSPGLMVQLGLLGFIYSYRHPALEARTEGDRT